jgi:hypothetical protein
MGDEKHFDPALALLAARQIEVDCIAVPFNHATRRSCRLRSVTSCTVDARYAPSAAQYASFHVVGDAMSHWLHRVFGDDYRSSTRMRHCGLRAAYAASSRLSRTFTYASSACSLQYGLPGTDGASQNRKLCVPGSPIGQQQVITRP